MQAIYQKGNYCLLDEDGKETGRLIKEGVFPCNLHIETQDGLLKFIKDGFFSPVKLNRKGRDIGEVKSSWDGIRFKVDWGSRIHLYKLSQKSIWKSTFKFTNENKEELMSIMPQFKWRKMNYDYRIEVNSKQSKTTDPLIVLLAVYGVRKLLEHQYEAS
jgi:hypothetical protein